MKVLLINTPYLDRYGPIKYAAGRYFPLGLGYIAAYLREKGDRVSICEPEAQGVNVRDVVKREKPDIVGITSATPNFRDAMWIAYEVKEIGNILVVYGGAHASALPEWIVDNFDGWIDHVVVGEGELAMEEITGSGSDEVIIQKSPIQNLDSLPYPARDLIPQELFYPSMHNRRRKRCATILTSRGCPFNCSFCASFLTMGKKYRTHSAEYVVSEILHLKSAYGIQQLIINDDTFTLNRERLVKICELMIRENLNIEWFCFSQIPNMNVEILNLMRRAGCYNIGFGVESADWFLRKDMGGKVFKNLKCREVFDAANAAGMKTQAFFVFGESSDVDADVKFAKSLNPTLVFFNMLMPFPGTREFDRIYGDTDPGEIDWENFVAIGTQAIVGDPKALYRANLKFYLRVKQVIHLLSKIRTWHEFTSYCRGGIGLILQMIRWK